MKFQLCPSVASISEYYMHVFIAEGAYVGSEEGRLPMKSSSSPCISSKKIIASSSI